MHHSRSSSTATLVAYMRALAHVGASHVRDFHDPRARIFLSAKWTRRLARDERQLRSGRGMRIAVAHRVAGHVAVPPGRSREATP